MGALSFRIGSDFKRPRQSMRAGWTGPICPGVMRSIAASLSGSRGEGEAIWVKIPQGAWEEWSVENPACVAFTRAAMAAPENPKAGQLSWQMRFNPGIPLGEMWKAMAE
jgi:hypothetical protein